MFSRFLLIYFSLSSCLFAQSLQTQNLFPIQIDEKWGYINEKGKIIVRPQFDEAYPFSEGLGLVETKLKRGFINSSGKFIIEPKYTFAFSFSEGLAAVGDSMDSLWEYIDRGGKTAIAPKFSWAGRFNNGLAEVLYIVNRDPFEQKTGYIDKEGNFIIEPKFENSESFSDGLAIFAEDKQNQEKLPAYFNRKAFMDVKGNPVTAFYDAAEDFSEGLAAVKINNLWGFINKSGNIIIAPQFDFIVRGFSEGIAFVNCENDKTAAIDKSGKYITDCIFDEAWAFSEGLSSVQLRGKFGFIDRQGKFIIKPKFDSAESFRNGLAKTNFRKEGWLYTAYINRSGQYVFEPVKSTKLED